MFPNHLIVILYNIVNTNTIFHLLKKDKLDLLKLNIDILTKLGKTDEAQILINKLISDNEDTNLEDDILLMNSDLALKSGDLKKAVNLLKVYKNKLESFNKG
jgi:hypothetical protein